MRVNIGDVKLFFDVEGCSLVTDGPRMRERPTLLLLHGAGGDHTEYKPYLSQLADCAQVVYLDQRGCGRSDPSSPEKWSIKTWAADVHAFCEALEIERPVVLGSSLGSIVALRYAIDYPDHLSKLILLASAARMDVDRICEATGRFGSQEQRDATQQALVEPTIETWTTFIETSGQLYSVAPLDQDRAARGIMRQEVSLRFLREEATRFDHRAEAAGVRCPVLVISGAQDFVTPLDAGRELAESLPADLVEFAAIENASHELLPDASDQVVPLLRRFVMK
ncbi:MAG TPA: alpha/beta hydrolase [Solirubrobacteraceae bacterium]|jgi:proline iminopeptidase|nr:alpha/beta hydrolase [Solirubrobacteraceae bacterium]